VRILFITVLARFVEDDTHRLIPTLRRFNIKFAAYSPLAGGFLIGHLLAEGALENVEEGSHFDPNLHFGMYFQDRYRRMVGPVRELRDIAVRQASLSMTSELNSYMMKEKHGLNLNQASVRWLQHHSAMIPSDLGIVFGGSKPSHVGKTLEYR
jgi:aflatoxin B1 aldehyde reductase